VRAEAAIAAILLFWIQSPQMVGQQNPIGLTDEGADKSSLVISAMPSVGNAADYVRSWLFGFNDLRRGFIGKKILTGNEREPAVIIPISRHPILLEPPLASFDLSTLPLAYGHNIEIYTGSCIGGSARVLQHKVNKSSAAFYGINSNSLYGNPRPLIGMHDIQLAPKNYGSDASKNGAGTSSYSSNPGPSPYVMGQWIVGGIVFSSVIFGLLIQYVDDRRPKKLWIVCVFVLFVLAAAIFQLLRLSSEL
jgi:hypothetical protein